MTPPAKKKTRRRRKKKNPLPLPSDPSSNPSNQEPASLDSAGDGDGGSSVATTTTGEGGEGGEDAPFQVVQSRKGGSFRKQKAAAASAGMVSDFLRKDYVAGHGRKGSAVVAEVEVKGVAGVTEDAAEQFLCSVLGDDSDLHLGVVRDVLCQFGYDVGKSLDYLLELSASSHCKDSGSSSSSEIDRYDSGFLLDQSYDDVVKGIMRKCQVSEKQMIFQVSKGESRKELDFLGDDFRDGPSPQSNATKADLQMSVLESLFNIPKSAERVPKSMDWKKVVSKMESLKDPWKSCPDGVTAVGQIDEHVKGNEYQVLREPARQHWDAMKSYYQKAAAAHSRGQRDFAAYLSEQGRMYNKKAREEDDRASQRIFEARNKKIQNIVTIDLHGQHVEQAMDMLKLHLYSCSRVPSIQYLNVITGCGAHGIGKGILKQSVIGLLENEGIEWTEENRGSMFIKLGGRKVFNFLNSECDSE